MGDRLSGRVLVTGAGGGIGSAICDLLDARGVDVVRSDVEGDLPLDVTDTVAVMTAVRELGPLDGLVLAHGITALGPAGSVPLEAVERVIAVNLTGAIAVTVAALPGLAERRGRIGILSSVAGFGPLANRSAYAASKHGVHGWFGSLRAETAGEGVSVTIVAPSFTATGIESRAAHRAEGSDGDWSTTGEVLTPEQVALAAVAGMDRRARLVLPSRTARLAHLVARLAPATYERTMRRRILGS